VVPVDKPTKLPELVVLGLLNEKPRYGYEIKTVVDHVMSHIIDMTSGSLYYTLKKLREQELIEESGIEKIGRRPERSIYKITDKGKELLDRDLPGLVFPHARPFFPVDAALYFFQFLDRKATARRIQMRLLHLEKLQGYIDELDRQYSDKSPLAHNFILRHHRVFNEMEAGFLKNMEKDLVKEKYELNDRDIAEVEREFQDIKSRVRYDTFLSGYEKAEATV
jgi:DNA-binding PadR family transcriptional regulator